MCVFVTSSCNSSHRVHGQCCQNFVGFGIKTHTFCQMRARGLFWIEKLPSDACTEIFHVISDLNLLYYMEKSVLLGTKPLVDSICHFIRDPSGVFSVCHLCECRIVQWRHDSRLLLLLNWFLHIIKRTLHGGSKIWILCSRGKNNISRVSAYCSCHSNIKFKSSRHRVISSVHLSFYNWNHVFLEFSSTAFVWNSWLGVFRRLAHRNDIFRISTWTNQNDF